jgi:hypothetical protein
MNWITAVTNFIALVVLCTCIAGASYELGKFHGRAERPECKPQPQKSAYDLSHRQLKRMIRYELAKGGAK